MNPITVRLMGRTKPESVCHICKGKKGQYWKSNSSFRWIPCPVCQGNKEKGKTS